MFSRRDDTSKIALAFLAELAAGQPYRLIDCQVYNPHLASLGAREISREAFEAVLADAVPAPARPIAARDPVPAAQMHAALR
jgi:leucyl/phenylalanyl-tRNA--protein transferase